MLERLDKNDLPYVWEKVSQSPYDCVWGHAIKKCSGSNIALGKSQCRDVKQCWVNINLKGFMAIIAPTNWMGWERFTTIETPFFPYMTMDPYVKKYKDVTTVKILKHNIMSYVQGGCHYGLSQKNY